MPIYEYKCQDCGHIFECICNAKAGDIRECEECGGKAVRLFPTKVGLVFKGDGFYITDYKDKKSSPPTESKPKPQKEESKKPEKKVTKAKDSE